MTSFVYMHGAVAVPLVVREDRAEAGRGGGRLREVRLKLDVHGRCEGS